MKPMRCRGAIAVAACAWSGTASVTMAQAPDYQAELRALRARAPVARAFQVIEELESRTMSDLIALTQVAAPPFKE
jgi:hypothetical protein